MAKNKTTENNESVTAYINAIPDEKKRSDFHQAVELFTRQSGFEAKMWGTGIIGFGSYHYKYESGREGDAPLAALASRSSGISLYLSLDASRREEWLSKLGKHKTGKGCIQIKKLEDVDLDVLSQMIQHSVLQRKEENQLSQ